MYPTSAAFKKAIRRSHTAVTRAEVWRSGQKVLELDVADGTVEIDSRRSVRRNCNLTIVSERQLVTQTPVYNTYTDLAASAASYTALAGTASSYQGLIIVVSFTNTTSGTSLVPNDAWDALAPFGNEIRLWRGIVLEDAPPFRYDTVLSRYGTYNNVLSVGTYNDLLNQSDPNTEELIPLGVFAITNVDVEESDKGLTISLTGSDRSLKVSRARWTSSYKVTQDVNVATAIDTILSDRYADVETAFSATTAGTGSAVLGTEADNDPWKDAQKIAESAGMELFFDGNGIAVLQPSRDYENASPDAVYRENEEAMVLSIRRTLTNEQTYNGVIVTAENTANDVIYRAEAWDDDPASPTYRYGSFGQVPYFYYTPLIRTQEQANAAATARLSKVKGAVESVDWMQIVDPSLDAGDVIAVYNTDAKVQRLMVLDKLTIPLNPSQPMSATARTIRTLDGESFAEEMA